MKAFKYKAVYKQKMKNLINTSVRKKIIILVST